MPKNIKEKLKVELCNRKAGIGESRIENRPEQLIAARRERFY